MTVSEARALCVDRFPSSPNRQQLFDELERLIAHLRSIRFRCEVWINGSFTCDKEKPDDIDLATAFWAVDAEALDASVFNGIMTSLNGGRRFSAGLDSYLCPRFDRYDPRASADLTDYWADKWGKGRDGWLKGFIVIGVEDTDAQRRLLA
jgi:hypothetical protein